MESALDTSGTILGVEIVMQYLHFFGRETISLAVENGGDKVHKLLTQCLFDIAGVVGCE